MTVRDQTTGCILSSDNEIVTKSWRDQPERFAETQDAQRRIKRSASDNPGETLTESKE